MFTSKCYTCGTMISGSPSVCPACRQNPRLTAGQNRDAEAYEANKRFEKELRLREDSERRLHREFSRSNNNEGGTVSAADNSGCLKVFAVLFVLGLILSFFQWLGGQISLRFGEVMLLPASALLVIWLVAAAAALLIGSDKDWSAGKTLGPSIGWVVAMLLIMFLPANVGFGATRTGPSVDTAASGSAISGDSQAAADQAASLAIAADMATLPPAPQPVIDLGVAEVPDTPAEPPISELPQDVGLSVSTEVAPGQAEGEEPSAAGVHEGAL